MSDEDDRIHGIESALVAHWSNFGRWPGAELHEGDGILWYESPIPRLPYNGVIRACIDADAAADEVIGKVAAHFKERGAHFMWVHRPSDRPGNLGRKLALHGLDLVEAATGMDVDLDGWQAPVDPTPARIAAVTGEPGLSHYEELIRAYWSLPEDERSHVRTLNHFMGPHTFGVRFVAYLDDRPVGKLFLNETELPARVALYGVSVLPEARGKGIASGLVSAALLRGKARGAKRAVLHSSEMAKPLYARLGFVERCRIDIHATGELFGTHHH